MSQGLACTRCGKPTVLTKTWNESVVSKAGTSNLTYQQYDCPDAECQKKGVELQRIRKADTQAREEAIQKREQNRAEARRMAQTKPAPVKQAA
jgi:hypothetical protein